MPVQVAHRKHVAPCALIQELFTQDLPARLNNTGLKSANLVNVYDCKAVADTRERMTKLLAKNPTREGKNYNNGVLDAINCLPKS